jgi:hypothetical protein
MSQHPIYKITSIGRPIDPGYPTNKAVLYLLPAAAILAVAFSFGVLGERSGSSLIQTGLQAVLVAFGSWALARELAPDDNPAAFISMALAFIVYVLTPGGSILLIFVALALSRILNRSTGLAPRVSDSAIVTALVTWAAVTLGAPCIAIIAALAFLLDTRLHEPERRQWLFAIACIISGVYTYTFSGINFSLPQAPASADEWLTPLVLLVFLLSIMSVKSVSAAGDVNGIQLQSGRVRSAALIVFLLAAIFLFSGSGQVSVSALLIAAMAGVPAGVVLRSIRDS